MRWSGLPWLALAAPLAVGCGAPPLATSRAPDLGLPATGGPDAAAEAPEAGVATCGNGIREPGEECDDGNAYYGDCCAPTCRVERDTCTCMGPMFAPWICGDGVLTPYALEICDDGNAFDGDGCSADCRTVEPGYHCAVPGQPCTPICGDGAIVAPETCDDGNTADGDGCSSICLAEPTPFHCGDGIRSGAEECDDGAGNADGVYGGCSARCRIVGCGDGVVNGPEECDDGPANTVTYGSPTGCAATCVRSHFCGDGILDPNEQCDDGNDNGRDGRCTSACRVTLWLCP
jgi:cysteine-rich repeat protein